MTTPAPEPGAGLLDTVELTRRLRETEAELARVTLRLRRLESSGSVQLALLLAAAVRHPRSGLGQLPRESAALVRRVRARRAARPSGPSGGHPADAGRAGAPASSGPVARQRAQRGPDAAGIRDDAGDAERDGAALADRLLRVSAVLVAPRDRPVLAVVADPPSADAWSGTARVQRLRPDDATAVFAAVTPDLLVVEAGAGRIGPWSGLGTYLVPERDRTVLELLRAARDRRIPTLLVRSAVADAAPMLADARSLFSAEAAPGASVDDLLAAAGRVAA